MVGKPRHARSAGAAAARGAQAASRTLLAGVASLCVAVAPGCSERVAQASLGTRDLLARERDVRLLDGGTLLRRVELSGGGSLRIAGRADGPGSLTARVSRLDEAGRPSQPAGEAEAAAPVAGPVEAVLQLPDPGPAPLEIEVAWRGQPGGTSCTLDGAVVTEREPRSRPSIIFVSIDTLAA